MKKLVEIIGLVFFLFSVLTAQNNESIDKYRPTDTEFYKTISQGIESESVKLVKMLYNSKGEYNYTQSKSFNGAGKSIIFQIYGNIPKVSLLLKNLTLKDFNEVTFYLFNVSDVKLDNCSFVNIKKGVVFEFKENLNPKDVESKVLILNSKFIDSELEKNKTNVSYQLQFRKNSYAKGLALLKNVTIENCNFRMYDPQESWLIKSANNTYPKRHSILFYRVGSKVAYSNVTIKNNRFEGFAPYYRTEAITFANSHNSDFRTPNGLYEQNRNIEVINNKMETNSEDPGHAIFIQGPYKTVKVDRNNIKNYGMNMFGGKSVNCDGAIDIYGARNAKYSDDIVDVSLSYNIVSARGIAMKVLGVQNIVIKQNKIKMLSWPKFYKESKLISNTDRIGIRVATGAYKDETKQSTNVLIDGNTINCNYEQACLGIISQGVKNSNIIKNKIINATNYGILFFGHNGEVSLGIGNSSIKGNKIDFGNQNIKSLQTNFYKAYNIDFAAIKVHRMANGQKYKNESLVILNNTIIDQSNSIPKASIVDLTNSQLLKNSKSDILIEK